MSDLLGNVFGGIVVVLYALFGAHLLVRYALGYSPLSRDWWRLPWTPGFWKRASRE